mmetsp:Transcript_49399/g.119820  ORF Transcript_49399/g.119820 Transcript_49399/m.119820 type:complete len:358 (+) Transcript_49399:255-1328(+)
MMKNTNRLFLLLLTTYIYFSCIEATEDVSSSLQCSSDEDEDATTTGTCRSYLILGPPEEFTDSTIPDVRLAVRRWVPTENSNNTKAAVVFQHGGAGFHSGYSDIMGSFLKERGIVVIAYDIVGSGYSTGIDGLRNYFPNMTVLADDLSLMIAKAREEYSTPALKVFAIGESFGGNVLATQILQEQEKGDKGVLADGYIFTGPVVKLLPEMLPPKFVIVVLTFLARFFPLLGMPGTDFFSTFDLAFGDKGWAKAGRNDPFVQEASLIPPRLGMIASVLSNMDQVYQRMDEIRVPFKIFMGENEGRVDTDAVRKLAEVASSKDKSIEIVDGAYHQLFQDQPEVTTQVCEGIVDWIKDRL